MLDHPVVRPYLGQLWTDPLTGEMQKCTSLTPETWVSVSPTGTVAPYVHEGDDTVKWKLALKTVDQAKTSDTVLADDPTLVFQMGANFGYAFRGRIFFDTVAAADFKWRHAGPSAPSLVRIHRRSIAPSEIADFAVAVDTAYSASDIVIATLTGTTGGWIALEGIIHNGGNSGVYAFRWAQNTSDAGQTIVRAGSYLEYVKL